ncbi:DUF5953 family protein [Frateuria sp. GZRR35]|uniref:DUF5953 family protein n=1 Tax=Frateuria sp. GZRR35 TaxID=3351536 RepID=UPI003EDBD798
MMYTPTYAMPGRARDWPARIERACQAIEATFDVRLDKATPYREGQADIELSDRTAFLKGKARSRTKWLNVYTGTGIAPTPTGYENIDYYALSGRSYANAEVYHCGTQYPAVSPAGHEALLVHVGDALGAHWGQYLPVATARRLRRVQWCSRVGDKVIKEEVSDLTDEERRLPWLVDTRYAPLECALQPGWLGWLNYWSGEVADYLGFPGHGDLDLLPDAYRTPAGAWLVKVGKEPLDAGRPDHLALLARVYERLPRLGARPQVAPELYRARGHG